MFCSWVIDGECVICGRCGRTAEMPLSWFQSTPKEEWLLRECGLSEVKERSADEQAAIAATPCKSRREDGICNAISCTDGVKRTKCADLASNPLANCPGQPCLFGDPKLAARDEIAKAIDTTPAAEPVDVVYTLSNGSRWNNNELRYSLRSLEKNLVNLGRVFIVGPKLPWLTGVIHIEAKDSNRNNKDANIINKVLLACKNGVSERFLVGSDDQCLLVPCNANNLPARSAGNIPKDAGKGKWRKRLARTGDWLLKHGYANKMFDTHVITPHTRTEFMAAAARSDYEKGSGYTIHSLCQNQNPKLPAAPLGRTKLNLSKKLSADQIRAMIAGKKYLGYNDGGLSDGLKSVLAELLPEKSRFEADGGEIVEVKNRKAPDRLDGKNHFVRGNTYSLVIPEELAALKEVVASLAPSGRFLEIGTKHGLTAALLAETRPDVTFFSVDLLRGVDNKKWQSNRLSNMRLLVGTVQDLMDLAPSVPFDAAFIDGDHHYQPVLTDLSACTRLVRPGGAIIAHDYQPVPHLVPDKPEVPQAVNDFCRDNPYRVKAVVGSLAFLEQIHVEVSGGEVVK